MNTIETQGLIIHIERTDNANDILLVTSEIKGKKLCTTSTNLILLEDSSRQDVKDEAYRTIMLKYKIELCKLK